MGPQVANEVNSTSLNVDKVADEKLEVITCNTSLNVDKAYEVLAVDCTFKSLEIRKKKACELNEKTSSGVDK